MIKLFRRIRQRLLSENKFSKYLIYAAGEIVLVVIGILIALKINHWNNYATDREKEKAILEEVNREFRLNKLEFNRAKSYHQTSDRLLDTLLASLPWTDDDLGRLFPSFEEAVGTWTLNPSQGVTNSLINSGNYELIQNDTLRNLLLRWNDVYEDFLEEELNHQKFRYEVMEPLVAEYTDLSMPNNPESMLKNSTFFKSVRFRNLLFLMKGRLSPVIKDLEDATVEEHINEIIRLTEQP